MKLKWNPQAVKSNRKFRQRYGVILDGLAINKVAAYVSVFGVASVLFVAGLATFRCASDWTIEFSGHVFIALGMLLWGWNGFVGFFAVANVMNCYSLKRRHHLPILKVLAISVAFSIVAISGIGVMQTAIHLQFDSMQVCPGSLSE